LTVADLEDAELSALEKSRPRREFCWTCTPALSAFMMRTGKEGDMVVYLDADLLFFADPRILLRDLDDGGAVLIHEHRFSPDRMSYLSTSGRFNVGFVGFRVCDEGRACVERWRDQTFERCELDSDNGYCGDQGYLNEWPGLYPNLRIMQNIGGGVAPWNVNQYQVGCSRKGPTVDDQHIVFFHYHALRTVFTRTFGFVAVEPAYGYEFGRIAMDLIFRPYARRLRSASRRIERAGFAVDADRVIGLKELVYGLRLGQFVQAI
jgi:hypothetical protein